jgi:hypothetical protein
VLLQSISDCNGIPFTIDDEGKVKRLQYRAKQAVFASDEEAFEWILEVARKRGVRGAFGGHWQSCIGAPDV